MRKIGLISLALVLALGAMGAGIAYFSDTATDTKTFAAGTIDLQVSDDGGTSWYQDLTLTVGPDWAPGDVVQECESMRNIGSTGGKVLRVGVAVVSDPNNLASKIELTKMIFSENSETCPPGAYDLVGYYTTVFGDGSAPLLLSELIGSEYNVSWPDYVCVLWGPGALCASDYISPGGADIECMCWEFQFDPTAGNEYQGKSITFRIDKTLTDDCAVLGIGGSGGYGE